MVCGGFCIALLTP
ncbi:hypothetical protein M2H34_21420 [Vibrio vulnificus]|nr:hypothetical protein [Vibrio vulnificus]